MGGLCVGRRFDGSHLSAAFGMQVDSVDDAGHTSDSNNYSSEPFNLRLLQRVLLRGSEIELGPRFLASHTAGHNLLAGLYVVHLILSCPYGIGSYSQSDDANDHHRLPAKSQLCFSETRGSFDI